MIARILRLTLMLLLTAATAAAQPPKLVAAGQLTWGTSPTFVPFEFEQDGVAVGFDVDLMNALGAALKLQPALQTIEFKGLIPALLGHRVDAVASGMYITPQRQEAVDFVPYVRIGNQIIVRHGNPLGINGADALCGHRVAVPVSTAFEAATRKASGDCVAAGKPEITILSLPGSNNVALALQQDRADAALNSTATAAAMVSQMPDAYALAGEPFDTATLVGIAVGKDNPALAQQLGTALHGLVQDGTYAGLLRKWHLPAASSAF